MLYPQNSSFHVLWPAGSTVATNNTTVEWVDTQPTTGAQPNYLTICVFGEVYDETNNNAFTSTNPVESDDTVQSNFATFTGFVGGTDYTAVGNTSSTANTAVACTTFNIDLRRSRKRYIGVVPVAANATATDVAALAILGRYGETPGTVSTIHVKG